MQSKLLVGMTFALSVAVLAGTLAVARQQSPLPASRTAEDLKVAYTGETAARAKYAAYARKAEEEGCKNAAALFRAASEAERVHARNHKAVLMKLGTASLRAPGATAGAYQGQPGSTAENLQDALRSEAYERDTMYPAMIERAAAEGQTEAVRTFTYAVNAERQHATLYRKALEGLGRTPTVWVYLVCPTCGATFANTAPSPCPTCGTFASRFKRFR